MFSANFIESMMKCLEQSPHHISKVLEEVMSHESKFLTKIEHPKAAILHINREKYYEILQSYEIR